MKKIFNVVFILGFLLPWDNYATAESVGLVDHSRHKQMMNGDNKRSIEYYKLPQVKLVNQNGIEKYFEGFLGSDKLVVMDFIFTTCTTICPVLSAGLSRFQEALGEDKKNIKLISITIDPEHDRPSVLKRYRQRHNMKAGHDMLTGSRQNINKVMKAFDALMPNKMTHHPLTFFRAPGTDQWIRVSGLMSLSDLMKEYKSLTAI